MTALRDPLAPALCKLGHVELVTPDLDRSLGFFAGLLGLQEVARDGERVYLRCFGELDHHSLVLREGPTAVDHIGFRTSRPEHVDAFAAALRDEVDVTELPGATELGQGPAVRFLAPWLEAPFELYHEMERPLAAPGARSKLPTNSTRFWPTAAAVRRIDHVNLSTAADVQGPAQAWVREQLGFQLREYVHDADGAVRGSWLSVTSLVHDLAITIASNGQRGQLNHIAFAMDSFADIARAAEVMVEHDVQIDVAPGRHGVTQGYFCYVRDPGSGHRVELFSGGYLIFDPDWEPIGWPEADFEEGRHGLAFFGPRWSRENNPNAETTPCIASAEAAPR